MSRSHIHPFRSAGLAILALVIIGCGGGGGLGSSRAVSLAVNTPVITKGSEVTLSWSTQGTDTSVNNGFERANFARIHDPLPTSGSVTDRPAITTTYHMRVKNSGSGTSDGSITVQVAKGTKRFLIVGGASSPDQITARNQISEVTSVTPSLSTSIPAVSTDFDALVLCEGGTFGPADRPTVAAWVAAGKGVIVVGGAGNQLASGSVSNPDTSSIASWFGGVSLCTKRTGSEEARLNPSESQIGFLRTNRDWTNPNATVGRLVKWSPWYEINTMSSSAVAQSSGVDVSAYMSSWSFVSGSARIYYIMGLRGPSSSSDYQHAEIRQAFLPGVRWASGE